MEKELLHSAKIEAATPREAVEDEVLINQ